MDVISLFVVREFVTTICSQNRKDSKVILDLRSHHPVFVPSQELLTSNMAG